MRVSEDPREAVWDVGGIYARCCDLLVGGIRGPSPPRFPSRCTSHQGSSASKLTYTGICLVRCVPGREWSLIWSCRDICRWHELPASPVLVQACPTAEAALRPRWDLDIRCCRVGAFYESFLETSPYRLYECNKGTCYTKHPGPSGGNRQAQLFCFDRHTPSVAWANLITDRKSQRQG